MNKTLTVLLLATLAACGGGKADKPVALPSTTPEPVVTTPAARSASPSPQALVAKPSPKPSPKPVATTASPKPRVIATKAPAPPAKVYANCTAMHVDYKGGVSLPGAVNKGGATQYAPKVSTALYNANQGKDRDHDGIACEA